MIKRGRCTTIAYGAAQWKDGQPDDILELILNELKKLNQQYNKSDPIAGGKLRREGWWRTEG